MISLPKNPEKLAELQRLWLIEAVKYNVRAARRPRFRAHQSRHRRAAATDPRQHAVALFQGMRVSEGCVLTLKNKSHSVTANVVVPESGAKGVIVTQGGELAAGRSTHTTES